MGGRHDTEPESEAEEDAASASLGYESSSSSSGDEESEKCPICLLRLKLQPVGRPEPCKHLFCLACITQWSQVTSAVLDTGHLY